MSEEDEENYNSTITCWICEKNIEEDKVRDHCHITDNFRGAAHKDYNLQLRIPKKLPIIFHNLEGYDGHFIFRKLNNFTNIQVIPKSTEKYMSIIINKKIIFLDSLQVMKASLAELADNLENSDYKHLLSEFPADKLHLLKKKDTLPYEWIDDYKKLRYTRHPLRSAYYSRLHSNARKEDDKETADKKYNHSKNSWQTFNFKTVRDLHDHYLRKDVLLLAVIFERFISTCMKYYNLDPTHYFSAAGLSWDVMLKMTKIQLEKISDLDKHIFIESGMRGGIRYAAKKYSKANNEQCQNYDPTKPKTEINYHDMNNLYGKAMMHYLPYKDFKWIRVTDKNINKVLNKKDTSLHGCILEVDIYLLDELHNEQNDFPMFPEKLIVTKDMLSQKQMDDTKDFNIKIGTTKKLIPNLFP